MWREGDGFQRYLYGGVMETGDGLNRTEGKDGFKNQSEVPASGRSRTVVSISGFVLSLWWDLGQATSFLRSSGFSLNQGSNPQSPTLQDCSGGPMVKSM